MAEGWAGKRSVFLVVLALHCSLLGLGWHFLPHAPAGHACQAQLFPRLPACTGWCETVMWLPSTVLYYPGVAAGKVWSFLVQAPPGTVWSEYKNATAASMGQCVWSGIDWAIWAEVQGARDVLAVLVVFWTVTGITCAVLRLSSEASRAASEDGRMSLPPRWLLGARSSIGPAWSDVVEVPDLNTATPESEFLVWGALHGEVSLARVCGGRGRGEACLAAAWLLELVWPSWVSGLLLFLLRNPVFVRLPTMAIAVANVIMVADGDSSPIKVVQQLEWLAPVVLAWEILLLPLAAAFGVDCSAVGPFSFLVFAGEALLVGVFVVAVIATMVMVQRSEPARWRIRYPLSLWGAVLLLHSLRVATGARGIVASLAASDAALLAVVHIFLYTLCGPIVAAATALAVVAHAPDWVRSSPVLAPVVEYISAWRTGLEREGPGLFLPPTLLIGTCVAAILLYGYIVSANSVTPAGLTGHIASAIHPEPLIRLW